VNWQDNREDSHQGHEDRAEVVRSEDGFLKDGQGQDSRLAGVAGSHASCVQREFCSYKQFLRLTPRSQTELTLSTNIIALDTNVTVNRTDDRVVKVDVRLQDVQRGVQNIEKVWINVSSLPHSRFFRHCALAADLYNSK
jgi:hypothetical protein